MDIDDRNGIRTVEPRGDLDIAVADEWRAALVPDDTTTAVVIDLGAVTFIDSAGLGILIGGVRRLREAGCVVALVAPAGPTRRTLGVAGLDRLVPLHDDREAAVTGFLAVRAI